MPSPLSSSDKCVVASAGFMADAAYLQKMLKVRAVQFLQQHNTQLR